MVRIGRFIRDIIIIFISDPELMSLSNTWHVMCCVEWKTFELIVSKCITEMFPMWFQLFQLANVVHI